MKKKLIALLGTALLVGCMTACGSAAEESVAPVKESIEETVDSTTTTNEETGDSDASTSEETALLGDEVYTCEDYSIAYSPANFDVVDVRGSMQFIYHNDATTNSNSILITKDEGTTVDEIINAIAGENTDKISDGSVGSQVIPAKLYSYTFEAPTEGENPPVMTDSFLVMQCGDGVITIEIIRTIEDDEGLDLTIDGAIFSALESFKLNK